MDIPTMNDIEQAARGNRILAIWLQAKDNLSDDQFYRAAIIALVGQVEALKLQAEKVDLATSKERNALAQELARARQETLVLARAQAADLVAVTTELDALRTLLTGAVPLLELAAEHCEWAYASGTDAMQAKRDAVALRELAQGLRALGQEEEEG